MAESSADNMAQHHLPERQAMSLKSLGLVSEQRLECEEPVKQCDQLVAREVSALHPLHREPGFTLYVVARRFRKRHSGVADKITDICGQSQAIGLVVASSPANGLLAKRVSDTGTEP